MSGLPNSVVPFAAFLERRELLRRRGAATTAPAPDEGISETTPADNPEGARELADIAVAKPPRP